MRPWGETREAKGWKQQPRHKPGRNLSTFTESPLDRDGHLLAETIVVMHLLVCHAIFVNELGELYVVTTILGDLQQLALLKPLDGLQTFGGFFHAKCGGGNGVEREA